MGYPPGFLCHTCINDTTRTCMRNFSSSSEQNLLVCLTPLTPLPPLPLQRPAKWPPLSRRHAAGGSTPVGGVQSPRLPAYPGARGDLQLVLRQEDDGGVQPAGGAGNQLQV